MKRPITCLTILVVASVIDLYADTTYVAGTIVNDTWTISDSPYGVTGDIQVAKLTIEPGVIVTFLGNYNFEVNGVLDASGTKESMIIFTQAEGLEGWGGISFSFSPPGSKMIYCVVEKSVDHGITIEQSTPELKNCWIQNNSARTNGTIKGGGVYGIGDITLIDCVIRGNVIRAIGTYTVGQYGLGGGIFVEGTLNLIGCEVTGNKALASASWASGRTYGGGVAVDGFLNMENCNVSYNLSHGGGVSGGISSGYGYGGGIWVRDSLRITNSVISYNTLGGFNARVAGGIYCNTRGGSSIVNSTIAYNAYEGVHEHTDTLNILNSILYFNTVQITGEVNTMYSNVQYGYAGEGNIDYNPVFYNDTTLIIVDGSPCIDAGHPDEMYNDVSFPPSLGGVRNDMGAHGGPGAIGWRDPSLTYLTITECDSYKSPSGLYTYTNSGTYEDTLQNVAGYDSVIVINLTILHSTVSTLEETVCDFFTSPSRKYTWTNSGLYLDTIPNSLGCDSIISIDLIVNNTNTSVVPKADGIEAIAEGVEYQWLDCSNGFSAIEGATNKSFTPTTTGSYAVALTKGNCVDTSKCSEIIVITELVENDFAESFKMYPNPTYGHVIIDLERSYSLVELRMKNLKGQLISKKEYINTSTIEFNLKSESGLFLIEVYTDEGKRALMKVVKD